MYPAEGMRAWRINTLKGNGPELLEPLPHQELQIAALPGSLPLFGINSDG